ncbi:hypothetical protein [Halomicrobium katesii]|uniref:hypothetical protein n=1 Tax=Halomicrobium katesii TaxID=437163 RepID=UPI00037257B8|nr:hypothetical protein [Halomicrobium katesii]
MNDWLKHPVTAATATAGTLFSVFQLDVITVLLTWGWGNLGQLFYMATLLVSSSSILPVSQTTVAKVVGALAFLLLLKLGIEARKQVNNRLEETES